MTAGVNRRASPAAESPQSTRSHSHDTGVAVLPGGDVQGRVSVDVHSVEVAPGGQQDLGDVHTAREGRPVQADVLLLHGRHERVRPRGRRGPPDRGFLSILSCFRYKSTLSQYRIR